MTINLPHPSAIVMHTDGTLIYVSLPLTAGGWHTLTFALTEGGLSRALNLLRQRHLEHPTPAQPAPTSKFTPALHAAARRALAKIR